MIILGIETSCDETSIAILKENNDKIQILANVVSSQIDIHKEFGGVVPEIASRYHLKNIGFVLDEAIEEAKISLNEINAIAVTYGPGLVGALLVGVSFAKALSYSLNIPLLPVHHIAGHIAANYLTYKNLKPPFIALVVSGGHSHIIKVEDYTKFKILAKTRDDAVGEAFDKVARVLGLGYPGGPEVSNLAREGKPTYKLPKTSFVDSYDFSFSGIKTAVMNLANKEKENIIKENICASFENTVVEELVDHTIGLMKEYNYTKFVLAGGVSANRKLREYALEKAKENNMEVYIPDLKYCTDNAAMITCAGIYNFKANKDTKDLSLNARANINIEE